MAKNRKRRHFEAEKENNAPKNAFNWKLAGKLLLYFAAIFGLYQLLLKIAEMNRSPLMQSIVMTVYSGATTIVACVFLFLNRGVTKDIPTKEQLRDDWSDEKKEKYIEKYVESKEKAKRLLFILIPLIFTLLFDTIYLMFFVK